MTEQDKQALMDETDFTEEKAWYYGEWARVTANNLSKRNVNAYYAATRQEALPMVMGLIPEGVMVGIGDSISLHQVGVIQELHRRGLNDILDPFERDRDGHLLVDGETREKLMRQIFTADVFLLSSNAMTRDGKIVNTDGRGNRVAPAIFGPPKVIYVVGANKIVRDEEEARRRIREVAAPLNARRHFLKHNRPEFGDLPCVRTGNCTDCNVDSRICHFTVITEGAHESERDRTHVVLVGEELGL